MSFDGNKSNTISTSINPSWEKRLKFYSFSPFSQEKKKWRKKDKNHLQESKNHIDHSAPSLFLSNENWIHMETALLPFYMPRIALLPLSFLNQKKRRSFSPKLLPFPFLLPSPIQPFESPSSQRKKTKTAASLSFLLPKLANPLAWFFCRFFIAKVGKLHVGVCSKVMRATWCVVCCSDGWQKAWGNW